jgi:hypothetical protein
MLPASSAAFHTRPKSLRFTLVLAEIPPRVFRRTGRSFDDKDHLAGDAANGEFALHGDLPCSDLVTGGLQCQGGKLFHMEEILALEMRITLTAACFDRGCIDGRLDIYKRSTCVMPRWATGRVNGSRVECSGRTLQPSAE